MDVTLGLVFTASRRKGWPMTCIAVRCLHCHSEPVGKRGKTHRGTQRYLCQNTACNKDSFLLDCRNRGCVPEVKQTIIDMSRNASGVRDTVRVLHISTDTVLNELRKKAAALESVNTALLRTLNPDDIIMDVERAGEAEMDEMWSFVGKKQEPRWLWHAIDHCTGAVLAYVFGRFLEKNTPRCGPQRCGEAPRLPQREEVHPTKHRATARRSGVRDAWRIFPGNHLRISAHVPL
jgi:transposase-like protein